MFSRLKNWLEHSGIGFMTKPENHREIIDSINPLSQVIENPKHPWARIYRGTVFQGITDTYQVLIGNHYDFERTGKGRKGVLDIFILPLISRKFFNYHSVKPTNPLLDVLAIPVVVIELARGAAALLLTAALSPLVLGVHMLAFFKANKLKNQVNKLNVVGTSANSTNKIKTTLGKWMMKNNIFSVDQIEYVAKIKSFRKKGSANISGLPGNTFFQLAPATPKNKQALDAFEALNIGKQVRVR